MPSFREIDYSENESEVKETSMYSRRMTPKEIEDYFKEYTESLEESKVEKDEVRDETELEMNEEELEISRVMHSDEIREVRTYNPQIGNPPIKSEQDLTDIILEDFLGITERDDYVSLLHNATDYLRLLQSLAGTKFIKESEVLNIAANLKINQENAIMWTFFERCPQLYRIMKSSLSCSDARQLVIEFREKLDGLDSWSSVQQRLDRMHPNKEYMRSKAYESKKQQVDNFFILMKEVRKGGTIRGIAKRTEISRESVESFLKGNLPYYINHILISDSTKSIPIREISIWAPEYNGIKIESIEQLKEIIIQNSPGMLKHKELAKKLRIAEVHLNLYPEFQNGSTIPRGLISKLARENDLSEHIIKKLIQEGAKPSIYNLMDRSLTSYEATDRLNEIMEGLNGVTSIEKMDERYENLFILHELQQHSDYNRNRESAKKFFRFLQELPLGGFIPDMASKIQMDKGQVYRWFNTSRVPRQISRSLSIPFEPLTAGYQWLPLTITPGNKQFEQFIEVPLEIESKQDILNVLENLTELRNLEMKLYEDEFGEMPKHLAFMYFLGSLISDGIIGSTKLTSTFSGLSLSKNYDWSKDFGRGFCYSLGKMGIEASQKKDTTVIKDGEKFEYIHFRSENSPFMVWIRRVALGLDSSIPKNNTPIQADWILEMPHEWRVTLLQGIADGDGWASIKAFRAGLSTQVNSDFFIKLLSSFEIESVYRGHSTAASVEMKDVDALLKSEKLPMFKHATGRQKRLSQLVAMQSLQTGKWIKGEEKQTIMELHREGFSGGRISEILWDIYGIARRAATINNFVNRYLKREMNKSE